MGYYNEFLNELPKRTLEILKIYEDDKSESLLRFEVTLLISLAMPVFVITSEKIRNDIKHVNYKSELKNIIIGKSFLLKKVKNCKIGKIKNPSFDNINGSELNNNLIDSEKRVLSVLIIIRNALSHGSIKFIPDTNNKIISILFGSKDFSSKYFIGDSVEDPLLQKKFEIYDRSGLLIHDLKIVQEETIKSWDVLRIDVSDFRQLLKNWCSYLQDEVNPMAIVRQLSEYIEPIRTGTDD